MCVSLCAYGGGKGELGGGGGVLEGIDRWQTGRKPNPDDPLYPPPFDWTTQQSNNVFYGFPFPISFL